MNRVSALAPGLALAALLACLATPLGRMLPMIGTPVFALVLGAAAGAVLRRTAPLRFEAGLELARQRLLAGAIVLLGLCLPMGAVLTVGRDTAVVLVGTLVVGGVAALIVGRLLAVDPESATLVAVGTTICGASAIAAATAVLRPRRQRVAYALGTIFVFNIVAVLAFPPLGRALGMSDRAFGLWAGTAINDTSSVLAAGVVFGTAAAQFAIVVKLVRSLAIVPLCIGLHLGRRRLGAGDGSLRGAFPLFVVLFVLASLAAGAGLVPAAAMPALSATSGWLVAVVLVAIGASLGLDRLRAAGPRPLVLGGLLGVILALSSLGLMAITGWV
ncbi:YeiH family protein [Nocardia thailandica]|uniref:YeiH family protein n=1 Tax=Nocardia thailandica TaxID=257275 RepID=UPI00030DD4AB|nr:putative sulfate exporter family transporter [Nocardia thailandica]